MVPVRFPLRMVARATAATQRFGSTFVIRANSTNRVSFTGFSRSYATPAKPKKGSIGETAKRGRVPKPSTTTRKAKSTSTKSKSKSAAKARPAKAKKVPAKEKALQAKERKAASIAKKKEQAAIAKEKKREKAARAREKKKADAPAAKIRLLKSRALLDAPKAHRQTAWTTFLAGYARNHAGELKGVRSLSQNIQKAKREYAALDSSEKESYARQADETNKRNRQTMQAWVEKRSANEIRDANLARNSLKRLEAKGCKNLSRIPDDRIAKKPITPYVRFFIEKYQSGGKVVDQAKEIGRLWKALSAENKQRYMDAWERDVKEHQSKYQQVSG